MIYQLGILICSWVLSDQVYLNTGINDISMKHFRISLVCEKEKNKY